MFKKLKDKIAEEVKQSPLKSVQQLAQAVVSPSSSSVFEPTSSNDKFCIEEGEIEEEEKSSQSKPGGFTTATLVGQTSSPLREQRRGSRSSIISEADHLFPVFEPQPTNFHLQSDWESASEVEDRYSQLEHINKESLYEAYRKTYNRYTKMKNKYQELVTHYRHLDKEKEKAQNILSVTQDKALMRISELREQCVLEQQAKAHLEEALRNKLEERDHIISSLKTKVQYLKGISDGRRIEGLEDQEETNNLIDFSETSEVPLPLGASVAQDIKCLEDKVKRCKVFFHETTAKIKNLKAKLEEMEKEKLSVEENGFTTEVNNKDSSSARINVSSCYHMLLSSISEHSNEINTFKENLQLELNQTESSETNHNPQTSLVQMVIDENELANDKVLETREKETQTQKLQEKSLEIEQLKSELTTLRETITFVESTLLKTNHNYVSGNLNIDDLVVDKFDGNRLVSEMFCCIKNLHSLKTASKDLECLKEKFESDQKVLKDEISMLNQDKTNLLAQEHLLSEIRKENGELKDLLQTLQRDNSALLSLKESQAKELVGLKTTEEEASKQAKEIMNSFKESEDKCNKIQEKLNETYMSFSAEKICMTDKILNLEKNIEKLKEDLISTTKTLESVSAELLSVKCRHEESDKENKLLKKELITLKEETNNFDIEKQGFLEKIKLLEDSLNKSSSDVKNLTKEGETLKNELNTLKKEYDFVLTEKETAQNQIKLLDKDLEENKNSYLSLSETAKNQSDQIESLTKERNKLEEENRNLQNKVNILTKELSTYETQNSSDTETKQKLIESLELSRNQTEKLSAEREELLTKIENINKLLIVKTEEFSEVSKTNESLFNEVSALKEEMNMTTKENKKIKNNLEFLIKDLKRTQEENALLLETKSKLDENIALIKNQKVEIEHEKTSLQNQIKQLEKEYGSLNANYLLEQELKNEILEKCTAAEKRQDDLVEEKGAMKTKIIELEEKLNETTQNQTLLLFENKELNNLNNQVDLEKKEKDRIQKECNRLLTELNETKQSYSHLLENNEKLNGEIILLKKEQEDVSAFISETKTELEKHKQINIVLDKKLNELTDSFKNKCDEVESMRRENQSLRTDIEKLKRKSEEDKSFLENRDVLRNLVLSSVLKKVGDLQNIKKLQQNLLELFLQFKGEIISEIKFISLKVESEFPPKERKENNCYENIDELECKSKNKIDLTNSKIKYLEEKLQKANEIVKHQMTNQINSSSLCDGETSNKTLEMREKNGPYIEPSTDNMSKFSKNYYKHRCDNLEKNLKRAICIIKYLNNLTKQGSEMEASLNWEGSFLFQDSENFKNSKLAAESSLQNEITALELFLRECEKSLTDLNTLESHLDYNNDCEAPVQKTLSTNLSATDLQLFTGRLTKNIEQESLDNQIKKHVQVQQDGVSKSNITPVEMYKSEKPQDSVENDLSVSSDISNSSLANEKLVALQKENSKLLQQLQNTQKAYDLKINELVLKYESKLEENDEEHDCEHCVKLGKKYKHIVNEMKEQIENLQQDLEEKGDAFENLYQEHQKSVKTRSEEVQQLRISYEKEMRDQDKKWRSCLDRRLAEEEKRHEEELAELTQKWSRERNELETASRLAVSVVESNSGASDLLRRQVQALTVQLNQLEGNRCEVCEHQRSFERRKSIGSPASIQDCTEMEYLRNILYEYMMGKETLTLAKVLCALVKFDDEQTEEIVMKEKQKITMLGQLGIL